MISPSFVFHPCIDTSTLIQYKTFMRIKLTLLLLLLFTLLISSCSGNLPCSFFQTATPTLTVTLAPSPTATNTPRPTATPTPLPAGRVLSGNKAFLDGDYDSAMEAYQLAFNLTSDAEIKAAALTMMGRIYFERNETQKALDTLRQVVERYDAPDPLSMAYVYLGDIYTQLLRPREAAEAFQAYLDLKPGLLDSHFQEKLGDALTADGQFQAANSAYSYAISASEVNPALWLEFKVAANLVKLGDTTAAIEHYANIQSITTDDYDRAQAEFLIGQIYYNLGDYASAYERFQSCVDNYPKAFDSYSALVTLMNDVQEVNNLNRGIVDYYAGQYVVAIQALNENEAEFPIHDGTSHYYKALSYTALNDYPNAIEEWDALIEDHPGDRFWNVAWDEKADTQWRYLGNYTGAAQTLLDFVTTAPQDAQSPVYLFSAARIYERGNQLDQAAYTWERLATEYPSTEISYSGIYLSGVTRYRQGNYNEALNAFQRALLLASEPADIASAYLWIGKLQEKQGDAEAAATSWQLAIQADPTGYYSERARDHLLGRKLFATCPVYDLAVDLNTERQAASHWMRNRFNLASDVDLDTISVFESDPRMIRGQEYWRLGFYEEARGEFEALRLDNELDPVNTYRLIKFFMDTGLYRSAIFAARQVLTLTGLDQTATFNAPIYFNHVRFGAYYREIVMQSAHAENIDPLLLLSIIRQESLFEGFIESSAGAKGLMQLMPDTAKQTATNMGWPKVYIDQDITRPLVNIRIGSRYLRQQLNYLNGDIYAALAAYNAGPEAAAIWQDMADSDPDLFLEVVRFLETRQYIRSIVELNLIYRMFYCR